MINLKNVRRKIRHYKIHSECLIPFVKIQKQAEQSNVEVRAVVGFRKGSRVTGKGPKDGFKVRVMFY